MGNKILGKRSRSFYKGFNDNQIGYIKQKFNSMSQNNILDKDLFTQSYQLNKFITDKFYEFVDFDSDSNIDQYQFICAVHTLCNMTISQLSNQLFNMITNNKNNQIKQITQKQLQYFTQICLKYNSYIQKKTISVEQIRKINKDKFKKYDYDKNKTINKEQFNKICTKDQHYKLWLFNMGFITKNMMKFHDQIYDLVDSDIQAEIQKHLNQTNPNIDKIKRGIQHRIDDDQYQIQQQVGLQSLPNSIPQNNNKKKQWQQQIILGSKDKDKNFSLIQKDKQNPNTPSQSLSIRHVFGYRSFDCRNNLKFDSNNNIIYHQGNLGIVMNIKDKKTHNFQQKYINQHKDDIVCLQVTDNLAITGQLGSKPSIMIWQTNQTTQHLKPKIIVTEQLIDSIANIAISKSKNNKLLAVSCNNTQHRIVIYNYNKLIQTQKNITSTQSGIIAYGNLGKNIIMDIKFTINQKLLVGATLKDILFVNFQNLNLKTTRGQFNNFSNSPSLCLLPIETKQKKSYMLSGMANGSIYFWQEQKCVKAVSGHTGSVSALGFRKDVMSFVSGDKSGKVIIWNQKFQKQLILNIAKTNSPSNMVISLSTNNKKQLLIGTKSSKAYLISLSKQNISNQINQQDCIITGHSEGQIKALSVDQTVNNKIFYTGGQDQRVIKWQYGQINKILLQKKLLYSIKSIDYNHLKKVLVIGYKNGIIELFNDNLQQLNYQYKQIKNPDQQTLIFLKFSPDSSNLIASYTYQAKSSQKKQYYQKYSLKIFNFTQKQIKQTKQIQQKSKIISADISINNKYIRLNTSQYQYFVYDIKDKPKKLTIEQIKSTIKRMKQQKQNSKTQNKYYWANIWTTHSTFMSPQTQGFKTQGVSQQDIICCERSRRNGNVFLIGDKFSKIKLFNYPCKTYPLFNKYTGHSNEVTSLQFNHQQDYLISIGGQQKSIFVWKYDPDQINNQQYYDQIAQVQLNDTDQILFDKNQGQQAGISNALNIPKIPKGQIKQPTNFKYNPKKDNILPNQSATINHVFGLRNQYLADQIRNQCRFTSDYKHIVFPTACLGVKMNIQTKQQKFYNQHKQDIVSFTIDDKRKLMATGQMAQKNVTQPKKKILSIYVWDIDKNIMLKKLDGFHTIAVVLLSFSPNSKLLFSVGNDKSNSFAVWDWKAGTILYSGPVSNGKVNGICWKSDNQFMTVGNDHVKIWQNGKGKQVKFPDKMKFESMFSCVLFQDRYISGSGKGNMFDWNQTKAYKGHQGKVQTLYVSGQNMYSGGSEGQILIWKRSSKGLQRQKYINTRQLLSILGKSLQISQQQQSFYYGILSIDISKQNNFLIGTNGSDVIYFKPSSKKQSQIVHSGHCRDELWGLTCLQSSDLIITGGDDKTVRLWDINNKKQITRIKFNDKIRGLDWYNNQVVIADQTARIHFYNNNLDKKYWQHEGTPYKNNKKQSTNKPFVQDIKFSPDGKYILYGTHGKSIIYQLITLGDKNNKKQTKDIKGGTSALLHIDWSRDSSMFAINTQAYQYRFHSVTGGQPRASSVRDQQWATWTRKIGFQSLGVFQGVDLTDVNTVCRHPSKDFLVAGYDDQTIKMYKYPTYIYKQVHKTFYGHSSHVTRVRFTQNYMVSTGGNDRTIIIWDLQGLQSDKLRQKKSIKSLQTQDSDDGIDDIQQDIDLPIKAITRKIKKQKIQDFYQVMDQGDQFMTVKPWLGAIKQPTYKFPKSTIDKPKQVQLKLQYVFGYRVKDCRQNLYYYNDNTIIFHAAAVLIFHDISKNKQTILANHNDDILSIDYHKETNKIMTGELGPKPLLCYYQNGLLIKSFQAPVNKGIISVSISPNAKLAVCVGIDEDHHMAVVQLNSKGTILAKQKSGRKVVTKIKWISQSKFVSIGINHFIVWNFNKGKISKQQQSKQNGNFVSIDSYQNILLTGSGNGIVHLWNEGQIKQKIILRNQKRLKQLNKNIKKQQQYQQILVGVVQCIKITKDFIACGTRQGQIYFLQKNNPKKIIKIIDFAQKITSNDINTQDISFNPGIRSIDFISNKILIGTLGSQIYQFNINKQLQLDWTTYKNILKCHYSPNNQWTNQVWGLTIHGDKIFTCSDDATIRYWSLSKRKLIFSISMLTNINDQLNQQGKNVNINKKHSLQIVPDHLRFRAIALSPQEKYIIVGSKDGTINVFKFDQNNKQQPFIGKAYKTFRPSNQQISDIKFGYKTLIIGSHDNAIYVYDFDEQTGKIKRKYKPMKKHSSYITHFDVSRDSCFLQSTCGAYQLLFWDLNSGSQITSGATLLKDQRWSSWTCNLGWPVQGIYPKCTDGTFINSVDRSNLSIKGNKWTSDQKQFDLLAVGNDNGKVCVYNYPSLIKSSDYAQGKGHSSHVTHVKWNQDDNYIISTGGQDQCVMIWKVQNNNKK